MAHATTVGLVLGYTILPQTSHETFPQLVNTSKNFVCCTHMSVYCQVGNLHLNKFSFNCMMLCKKN